jgi:hypothetical protein
LERFFAKFLGRPEDLKKISQFFKELSKQPKIAKISTSKGQFERAKHPHKTTFENLKIPTKKNIFWNCPISLHFFGLLHL